MYHCGDVVWANLDPSSGHEQSKRRPLIVVSNDKFNSHCNLTMTVPITSSDIPYPLHIAVGLVPGETSHSSIRGFAEIEQLKSLDLESREAVKVGTIDDRGMTKILELVFGCLISPEMTVLSSH